MAVMVGERDDEILIKSPKKLGLSGDKIKDTKEIKIVIKKKGRMRS